MRAYGRPLDKIRLQRRPDQRRDQLGLAAARPRPGRQPGRPRQARAGAQVDASAARRAQHCRSALPYRPFDHGGSSTSRASLARPGSSAVARRQHDSRVGALQPGGVDGRRALGGRAGSGDLGQPGLPVRRRRRSPDAGARPGSTQRPTRGQQRVGVLAGTMGGQLGRQAGQTLATVQRDHEMVPGPGARDVQQALLLLSVHLLVEGCRRCRSRWSGCPCGSWTANPPSWRPEQLDTAHGPGCADESPETITIGNSRPLAAWMVITRTASTSVSGSTASATRAWSSACRAAQAR